VNGLVRGFGGGFRLMARRGGDAKACMRVSSGEEGLMEYLEQGSVMLFGRYVIFF
jgi:hypothetical protein